MALKQKINLPNIKAFLLSLIKNPLFYIILATIIIDIVSKWCVVLNLKEHSRVYLIPNFLFVTLEFNPGGIFSFGANNEGLRIFLICVRVLLAIFIPIVYFLKGRGIKKRYKVCLSLIYAGCIGNLIDSLFYYENIVGFRGVVDWIRFTFFNATFNLADSYVTVSVILIIIFLIVDEIIEAIKRNRRGEFSMTPEEYEKHLKESKNNENNHHEQSK